MRELRETDGSRQVIFSLNISTRRCLSQRKKSPVAFIGLGVFHFVTFAPCKGGLQHRWEECPPCC